MMGLGLKMLDWLKLLRVKHWIKNLLVLFPILFAQEATDPNLVLKAVVGFFSFCFASSAIYIFNDICDMESDRLHPKKKDRPIASGAISKPAAIICAFLLLVASVGLTCLVASRMVAALCGLISYIILNLLYSWNFKTVPVLDVAILSIGFVLRILYGGAICDIPISAWLFLTTLALAIYLSLGKRMGELTRHGIQSRESLKGYQPEFLKSSMDIFMSCGLIFYSLWTISRVDFIELGQNAYSTLLILSVPLAMFILLKYNYVISLDDSDADPVEVVTGSKALCGLMLLWCVLMLCALYI